MTHLPSERTDKEPQSAQGDDNRAEGETEPDPHDYLPVLREETTEKKEARLRRYAGLAVRKARRLAGRIPFSEELVAAVHCALDRRTPARVRVTLLLAAAYFVIPTDAMPDFIAAFGFTDDATVLGTAMAVAGSHVRESHRARARETLLIPEAERSLFPEDDETQGEGGQKSAP